VSATFPPYLGGTGNVCYQSARELVRRGHQVSVLTSAQPGSPQVEIMEGIRVIRYLPMITLGNAYFLPNLIRIKGFDLIHLHYPFFGGELSGLAAKMSSVPLVITYHHDVVLQGWKFVIEKLLRSSIERCLLRSADVVLFTSEDYACISNMLPYLRGCEKRISFLPNGVDPMRFFPSSNAKKLKGKLGFESQDFIVLLVANLDRAHYFKGVDILLSALVDLPAQVKAIIAGDGELRKRYVSMSMDMNLSGRVAFTGRVTNEELRNLYQVADLTVLPSITKGEAFGLVLLESFACSTPVIASDLPGVRTVVDHGRDGFLVQPGKAQSLMKNIEFLFEHQELAEDMGRRGREKIEESYTWSKVVERLEGIYTTLKKRSLKGRSWSYQTGDWNKFA
jgi:glycosyltransferase involved in cell wall biosynthesis